MRSKTREGGPVLHATVMHGVLPPPGGAGSVREACGGCVGQKRPFLHHPASVRSDGVGHRDPRSRKPVAFFTEFSGELWAKVYILQRVKAQPLIVGRVPRNIGEGGQRHLCIASLTRPADDRIDQVCADALASMIRMNADLFEVSASIAHDRKGIADYFITARSDPHPTIGCVQAELLDVGQRVVGNLRHPDRAESLSCGSLNSGKREYVGW